MTRIGPSELIGIDRRSGRTRWTHPVALDAGNPVSDAMVLAAIAERTGEERWRHEGVQPGQYGGVGVAAGGHGVLTDDPLGASERELLAWSSATGEEVWRARIPSAGGRSVAVGDAVFVAGGCAVFDPD